jgi:multicomponent Na+:H+ antiporter subunit C
MSEVLTALPYAVAAWVLLAGCYGIATSRSFIHSIVCLSLVQSSTYLLLLLVGWSGRATAPVFADVQPGVRVVDPLVQALTLTDIVVGAAVTALLLALTIQLAKRSGTIDPDRIRSLEEELEE